LWTFREHSKGLSWQRFASFLGIVLITLVVRLGVLSIAGQLLPGDGWRIPMRLLFAATFSFVATFILSRSLVFRNQA